MCVPMIPEYTTVVGVDAKHLRQLSWSWPTWKKHKPSLLKHPMIVFYDVEQVNQKEIQEVVDHPNLQIIGWPFPDYQLNIKDGGDKWTNPQRVKMLSGFLHVAAKHVRTSYMLKIDTDTVATGDDNWIDPKWFANYPGIVAQKWGFTKPPDQMMKLDKLFEKYCGKPLNLIPEPGEDKLKHPRIISWCGFFAKGLIEMSANTANKFCGVGSLPESTQDGYMWYVATRLGYPVNRINVKDRGFFHWSSDRNVIKASKDAMGLPENEH